MSYYDHASLLALRLGPWANPEKRASSSAGKEIEAALLAHRPSAIASKPAGNGAAPVAALRRFLRDGFSGRSS
ncbi:hypothetical protein EKE94_05525 [Mesobaculum littorinae]|uniref:Uncharacterized protein n=1 Tax=Mesobaculum littorinae TaxID=2486419 RepID=A0A438AIB0_9RHOB|nr:hypothetical protein [Mesobaculum littorinae]RVV98384.1 hypothetical protein EKE94_05525 [Mesobaculum littorinae]